MKRALDGDWDGVAELYHPAAIQMPPDQPAVEGREAIRRALSRTLGAEGGVTLKGFSVCIQEAEGIADLVYVRAAYRLNMSVIVDDEGHRRRAARSLHQYSPPIGFPAAALAQDRFASET